jgi:hypothetical protein
VKADTWYFDGDDVVLEYEGKEVFRAKNATVKEVSQDPDDGWKNIPISFKCTKGD